MLPAFYTLVVRHIDAFLAVNDEKMMIAAAASVVNVLLGERICIGLFAAGECDVGLCA